MRHLLFVLTLSITPLALSNEPPQLLWGDTHLHTSYSSDAYTNNNLTADPHTAYRYAQGLPVVHPFHRARVQIETPLDFLVVSDHAELMGVIRHINREGVDTSGLGPIDSLKAWAVEWLLNRAIDKGEGRSLFSSVLPAPQDPREAVQVDTLSDNTSALPEMMDVQIDTWRTITSIADQYNQPGTFTALIGWEWSSIPGGGNLHRVVVTDSNADTAQRYQPFSLANSPYPEDLWQWLDQTSAEIKADFIAIPHNSNISKGVMFDNRSLRGEEFDQNYIELRRRFEPIAEITQIKGDSETHSSQSPGDAFADFENYPYYIQNGYGEYTPQPGDFIRPALRTGLSIAAKEGINPFQFGVIGSTDSHTALASAEEDNFHGKLATDSIPENKRKRFNTSYDSASGWAMSASGLAAVWAGDNTRESILQAMRKREVYATTGPRIRLQFFAGSELDRIALDAEDLYQRATESGVAMGGILAASQISPVFLVRAQRDPVGANLDRIQIVKGWLNEAGETQEQVFNVAWGGERELDENGALPAVGSTVDVSTAAYTNTIGADQLSTTWSDPQYNPEQAAFYYVRVLQIPTPRHSLYDAIALGLDSAEDLPASIQERAYSSSIWIEPGL